jgi:hypothetical protein
MSTSGKKSFLATTPSVVLALITFFGTIIILFALGSVTEGFKPDSAINSDTGMAIVYVLCGLFIALCCFYIVKNNPKSFWYVFLICNSLNIITALVEHGFWVNPIWWIPASSSWVFSIIAIVIGLRRGRRRFPRAV